MLPVFVNSRLLQNGLPARLSWETDSGFWAAKSLYIYTSLPPTSGSEEVPKKNPLGSVRNKINSWTPKQIVLDIVFEGIYIYITNLLGQCPFCYRTCGGSFGCGFAEHRISLARCSLLKRFKWKASLAQLCPDISRHDNWQGLTRLGQSIRSY